MTKASNGHAVDSEGKPVADPSLNVGAVVVAEGRRQDDLRLAEQRRQDDLRLAAKELADINNLHAKEIAVLRDKHATDMAWKESGRVDSLRQGDREETTRATMAAQANISTLATTTTQLADTLRTQVANTAGLAETRQSSYAAEVNKHFAEIDRALSEGKGSKQVSDPAMERLSLLVEGLASTRSEQRGMSDGVKLVIALLTLVSLYLGFTTVSKPDASNASPQVIYVPAPTGTQLPVTPPAAVPR